MNINLLPFDSPNSLVQLRAFREIKQHNLSQGTMYLQVSPQDFCEKMWINYTYFWNYECDALSAYVALCNKFDICIPWRTPDYCCKQYTSNNIFQHSNNSPVFCIHFFLFLFITKSFFLIHLFIYFWLCWDFVAACGLSLVATSGGYSSWQCVGFSLKWLLLLWSTGSRHVGFSSCGTWAQQLWLVGSRAQAQQLWRTGLVAPRHVGSSGTRDRTCVPCIGRRILNHCATREVHKIIL